MGLLDRLLARDRAMADDYDGETASQKATRKRREAHRARVARDGDAAGTKIPRSLRRRAF